MRPLPLLSLFLAVPLFAAPLFASTVQITPTSASVPVLGERQFGAVVSNATDTSVTWSVNGIDNGDSTVGTITAAGKYVAPATPPAGYAVTVTARSHEDASASASAAVQVRWQVPWVTSVTPSTVQPGSFLLTVNGSRFVSGVVVAWNGAPLTTTYLSSTQLTAAGNSAQPGVYSITVVNPGPAAVSTASNVTVAMNTPSPVADPQTIAAGRLLEQTTFGPTPALIAHVKAAGVNGFLDEQFAAPESAWPLLATATRQGAIDAFFANAAGGNDQLRQRVIYALSEVLVISMAKNTNGDEIVPWLQILSKNAFGNYRTLLHDITLDASMGKYLDMVNSAKPGLAGGANENYAREVMQLFTVGVGTYDQHDVQQMALALTGWTYGNAANTPPTYQRGSYYPGPMQPLASYHDTHAKTILGVVIPANNTPQQDVDAALDILFNHPNVPPFVAARLIRALVTSNPSPAYVGRVAAVFADNGLGVRGDLAATVRAILTDADARNDTPPPDFGRLRTPVQETIFLCRALGLPPPAGSTYNYLFAGMGEDMLSAPSVFGHYSPLFRIPTTTLFGPEFQIYTATESVNRANFLYSLMFGSGGTLHPALQPYATLASDPVALTNAFDQALLYGRMPQSTRNAIAGSLPAMNDNSQRVLSALYLTVTSGDFLVQH